MNGNQIAEKTLYDKYKKRVISFINSKYSNNHDIDDDVSEIMIKIFLNLKLFNDTKSKFSSWVFSIVKNHMIDKWRCSCSTLQITNTGNINTTIDCLFNGQNSSSSSFSINYDSNNTTNNFENCSSITHISTQLSAQDFTLLDMKYVQGYDYDEIGREFNLTSSTISNRVNYIKTKIKKNNSELIYE